MHAIYQGPIRKLKGKGCLVLGLDYNGRLKGEQVKAQFDDLKLPEAIGWRVYPKRHFKIEQ
jgi:hypothetical protein